MVHYEVRQLLVESVVGALPGVGENAGSVPSAAARVVAGAKDGAGAHGVRRGVNGEFVTPIFANIAQKLATDLPRNSLLALRDANGDQSQTEGRLWSLKEPA